MKFIYALSLVSLASALPGPAVGVPAAPRALHKVYNLHPREHEVLAPQLESRDEPTDSGSVGILETFEATIALMSTSIRANADIISESLATMNDTTVQHLTPISAGSTANTITNTTAGPGTNQLLLTGEHLIEGAIHGMTTSIQHALAHIRVTIDTNESGVLGATRGLTQRDINALATSLQELTSLMGTIRDISTLTLQGLSPMVKQVIRPDVNSLESSIGPLLQPIRTLIVSVINLNKPNPDISTTLLNGVPESLESILEAMVQNIL